jgi:hypothetical protein
VAESTAIAVLTGARFAERVTGLSGLGRSLLREIPAVILAVGKSTLFVVLARTLITELPARARGLPRSLVEASVEATPLLKELLLLSMLEAASKSKAATATLLELVARHIS